MKKGLLLLLIFASTQLLISSTHAYRDISEGSSLRPAIDYFMEKDILDGKGFFRGEDTMPATWFWEILLQEADFDPQSATFQTPVPAGVDPDSDEAQYLREAIRRGFIDKDIDFDPNRPIRRLEAIKLIVKTKAILVPERTSDKFRAYVKGVPPTAKYLSDVEAAFASGILGVSDIQPLEPHQNLKRKDLVRWLYNWQSNGQKKVSSLVKTQPRKVTTPKTPQYPYQRRQQSTSTNSSRIVIGPSTRKSSENIKQFGQDVAVFLEVLNQLEQKYYNTEELTPENRKDWINQGIEAAIDGVEDKYTRYIRPDKAADYFDTINGEFEGIGAYVEMIKDAFTIRSPIKGSPAEAAGLRPGDIVTEVDGNDISEQTINEIITQVKGPAGTEVKLKIKRGNKSHFEVTVTRGQITVPDVTLEMKQGIPVIGIHQFNRDTGPHVEKLLNEEVLSKKPRGIIFDLRNNPGGYLTAAVDVGSIFLPQGKEIFSVDHRNDALDRKYTAPKNGLLKDFENVAFLQNSGSASASEILTGMIQDYSIGKIIGQTSVGKGSVQELTNFSNGGSLKVTVAKWFTPKGNWINDIGITPDIEIEDATDEEKLNQTDRQLDRAVQAVLRGE